MLAGETKCKNDANGDKSDKSGWAPSCDETGGYSSLQCDQSSDSCWCVDRLGREIPRTRNDDKKRSCDVAGML